MRLVILGSGTAIPHAERGASGYACVDDEGRALLLECGPGSTRRWPVHGLSFEVVTGIVVTHHHVDHCSDLGAVLFGRNTPDPPVATPLLLAGPVGHGELLRNLEGLYGSAVSDAMGARHVHDLKDGDGLFWSGFRLLVREVQHAPGALGVRVEKGGASVAFSGDSGPCDALVELCTGVDLALLECSYPAGHATRSHLTAETAARVAVEAGVHRLVLTHFYPDCDGIDIEGQVRAAGYGGELHLAADGDEHRV